VLKPSCIFITALHILHDISINTARGFPRGIKALMRGLHPIHITTISKLKQPFCSEGFKAMAKRCLQVARRGWGSNYTVDGAPGTKQI